MASDIMKLEKLVLDPPTEEETRAAQEALNAWNAGVEDLAKNSEAINHFRQVGVMWGGIAIDITEAGLEVQGKISGRNVLPDRVG
jgi:hypothetical protein